MLDSRCFKLFKLLKEDEYLTAAFFAESIKVSDKTARTLLSKLADVLDKYGVQIEIRHGKGYRICINDGIEIDKIISRIFPERKNEIPNTTEERVEYLKEYLLGLNTYCKLEDLSQTLYISRKTITADLKKVEGDIGKYNLKMSRKPNHGIKICGSEFDFRSCIVDCLLNLDYCGWERKHGENLNKFKGYIIEILEKYEIKLSDIAVQNLIMHIYVMLKRIQAGFEIYLEEKQLNQFSLEKELITASEIADKISENMGVLVSIQEIKYIAIHLAGKKIYDSSCKNGKNLIITKEIDKLVTEILNKIYESFKIDFRDNLELRMSLSQHIVPLEVRIKFDMTLNNPLLQEVKEQYFLAYSIASFACGIISQKYNKKLDENEIGYFALSFALALERDKYDIRRKTILIVCSSGKGSTQLLKYKYLDQFGKYIDDIKTCDVNGISKINMDEIDYIFTTVPIKEKVKVPILEVQYFLESEDVKNVMHVLETSQNDTILKYYSSDLFISELDLNTKDEVLNYMCDVIEKVEVIPKDFRKAVFEREKIAQIEFGNRVAIPHPCRTLSKRTFACIAILKNPIIWEKQEVQVIFLISIEDKPSKEIQKFYKTTSKLLLNKQYISELIRNKDFITLTKLFHKVEEEM